MSEWNKQLQSAARTQVKSGHGSNSDRVVSAILAENLCCVGVREDDQVVGVVLLFLTMMLSFTGYLLPWDQIAYWAITIGSNMAGYAPLLNTPSKLLLLGGLEVGQNTLLRFYVLHVMVLPLLAAVFLAVHFWRIRKDGGISGPL